MDSQAANPVHRLPVDHAFNPEMEVTEINNFGESHRDFVLSAVESQSWISF